MRCLPIVCLLQLLIALCAAQSLAAEETGPWVPDQGDGTYRNPVLYADYSDPDAVRVGDDYWLTASSFNQAPGLPILHSKDMVNWQIVNHALPAVPPEQYYSKVRHGLGVYAPSIRHHNGEFFIFYGDPDFGIYMVKTSNPRGTWTKPLLIKEGPGYIDTCPLWDDDGKAYLVNAWAGSRVGGANRLTLQEMSPDGTRLIGEARTILQGRKMGWSTLEGPKLYKRGDWYWIFAPGGGVSHGYQAVARSKNIWGPYEGKIVLHQGATDINGPHQGAWLDTPGGEHWFLHFQKAWTPGRITHLQPMVWGEDGWPKMGIDSNGDGIGEPITVYRKPDLPEQKIQTPATSDEFENGRFGFQWQWQANPLSNWSRFVDRPDGQGLQLACVPSVKQDTLTNSPNLLLQKFPAPGFSATTCVEPSFTTDGDAAGLIVFGKNYSWLGLRRLEGSNELVLANFRHQQDKESYSLRIPCNAERVYLRVNVGSDWKCSYSWSENGETFTPIGEKPFRAVHYGWVGAKFGVFASSLSTSPSNGNAVFPWFRVNEQE